MMSDREFSSIQICCHPLRQKDIDLEQHDRYD